jgi:hypothetical protein
MRIRPSGIVLGACAAIALAGSQLAVPMSTAAAASSPSLRAAAHPVAYVPLRGSKRAGFDQVFTNMDYNGGPVMPSNTDYMVLWSPAGLPAYPAGYVSGLRTFFKDLAHDSGGHQNVDSVSAQYNDLTGAFARYQTTFGGALVDTDPYPPTECPAAAPVTACLTDAQIQTELEHFAASRGLKTDLSHEYFLLTPPHVESCFSNDPNASPPFGGCSAGEPRSLAFFCAYHQNTSLSPMLLYANDPFDATNPLCQDGNNPNGIADGEINGGLSHEQNESVTDPLPNDAWTNGAGTNQGQEVGDQCVGMYGTPLGTHNGAKYNQVINGHFYWFQEEWSNQAHSCLQRLTPTAARPHAMFTVAAGSGLTLNFDARGSSAPGGVTEYVWQFNDAFGAQTVEQTTPKICRRLLRRPDHHGQGRHVHGQRRHRHHRSERDHPRLQLRTDASVGRTAGKLLRAGRCQRAAGDDISVGIRRRHHRFGPVSGARVQATGTVHRYAGDVQRRRIGVPWRRRRPRVHAVTDGRRVASADPLQLSVGQAGHLQSSTSRSEGLRSARSSESFTWTGYRDLLIAAYRQVTASASWPKRPLVPLSPGEHARPAFQARQEVTLRLPEPPAGQSRPRT